MNVTRPTTKRWWYLAIIAVALATVGGSLVYVSTGSASSVPLADLPDEPAEATSEQVHRLCAACHAYPSPDTFPRSSWRKEVKQGYDFFHKDPSYQFDYPSLESVVRYYESRAPETLPLAPRPAATHACPARFDLSASFGPKATGSPGFTFVDFANLFRKDRPDVIACDALGKQVLVLSPYHQSPEWRVIATGVSCAHAEVVDLDGDGINDVVLAVLGNFFASDDRTGSVVWLRGAADGSFKPVTLLEGLGRVADVRAADFTGRGKRDLVVAEFGWHQTGSILLAENATTDWAEPKFVTKVIDKRHGTTHVPVADLNGDGRPDFVAVISQEHECVVAFLNEGGGKFRTEPIYAAPHPTYGCNGGRVVDLDGDGDLDVLLTNGDSLDPPYLLRPDHGVTWLENRGTFPYTPHRLADCYGVGSPAVADFDGNGLLDVAVVSFLPAELFSQRSWMNLDSVVLLEQTARGKFTPHVLQSVSCDHLCCAAGDLDGDGRVDLVIGDIIRGGRPASGLAALRNTTEKRAPR